MIENITDTDYQFYPTPIDLCLHIRNKYILKLDSEKSKEHIEHLSKYVNRRDGVNVCDFAYGTSEFVKMKLSYNSVLDPSAGKGDLINGIFCSHIRYNSDSRADDGYLLNGVQCRYDINTSLEKQRTNHYVIEIDPNLRSILHDNKFKILETNFFNYTGDNKFEWIVMNPPFKDGDKHLLHAIKIAKRFGSKIVCILNANTLKNPYSVYRGDLLKQIEAYNGTIEYIESAFSDAERKTNVEIAIVYLEVPEPKFNESYDDTLVNLKHEDAYTINHGSDVVTRQEKIKYHIDGLIESYETKKKFSLDLIEMYSRNSSLTDISLLLNDTQFNGGGIGYKQADFIIDTIKKLKESHWRKVFDLPEFTQYMTRKDRDKFFEDIKSRSTLEFSLENIGAILNDVRKFFCQSIEITIDELFDRITRQSNYYPEQKKNIHMYNGWKSNNGYKINNKFILPIRMYCRHGLGGLDYDAKQDLKDIEHVLTFFNGNKQSEISIVDALETAWVNDKATKAENEVMIVQYYQKGTTHITIKDPKIIYRFNQYMGKRKQWLPPEYGNKAYSDLDTETQDLVNEFEGVKSYSDNLHDPLRVGNLSDSLLLLN